MQLKQVLMAAMAGAMLTGCDGAPLGGAVTRAPDQAYRVDAGPPGAAPGTCWARSITPAVIETVTEQQETAPALLRADGSTLEGARYRTVTRQRILSPRSETTFELVCPDLLGPEFVSSLQRALVARQLYRGPVNGRMTEPTTRAVRRFQALAGLDTALLSVAAARRLGLVAVDRD